MKKSPTSGRQKRPDDHPLRGAVCVPYFGADDVVVLIDDGAGRSYPMFRGKDADEVIERAESFIDDALARYDERKALKRKSA